MRATVSLTLAAWQVAQRLRQLLAALAVVVHTRMFIALLAGEHGALAFAGAIERQAGGHAGNPGVAVRLDAAPTHHGSRQRLLGAVLGVASVSEDGVRRSVCDAKQLLELGDERVTHAASTSQHRTTFPTAWFRASCAGRWFVAGGMTTGLSFGRTDTRHRSEPASRLPEGELFVQGHRRRTGCA